MLQLLAIGFVLAALFGATPGIFAAIRGWMNSLVSPPQRRRVARPEACHIDPQLLHCIDKVEKAFANDANWLFRREPQPNFGIMARAEILAEGRPTGRSLPLLIAATPETSKAAAGCIRSGRIDDLRYWSTHSLPVCVIIVDLKSDRMLWQRIGVGLCEATETAWSIVVPATNLLDAAAKTGFEEAVSCDPEVVIRSTFALDRWLMEELQEQTSFFVWDEWIESARPFRNLRIYLGHLRKTNPDLAIDYRLYADSLHQVMTRLFPWATYSYAEPIMEYSDEVAVHILEVELRPEAEAYLEAESFFEAGWPGDQEPSPPEPYDFIPDDEPTSEYMPPSEDS